MGITNEVSFFLVAKIVLTHCQDKFEKKMCSKYALMLKTNYFCQIIKVFKLILAKDDVQVDVNGNTVRIINTG
jgi:hypothetical protein